MPAFERPPGRAEARNWLGLAPSDRRPVVLVLGGGLGLGVASLAAPLAAQLQHSVVVVMAGRNAPATRELLATGVCEGSSLVVRGWTDRMERLIAAADLVVGKPGGLTVAEALACGRPLLVANSLRGQESFNVQFPRAGTCGTVRSGRGPRTSGFRIARTPRHAHGLAAAGVERRPAGRCATDRDAPVAMVTGSGQPPTAPLDRVGGRMSADRTRVPRQRRLHREFVRHGCTNRRPLPGPRRTAAGRADAVPGLEQSLRCGVSCCTTARGSSTAPGSVACISTMRGRPHFRRPRACRRACGSQGSCGSRWRNSRRAPQTTRAWPTSRRSKDDLAAGTRRGVGFEAQPLPPGPRRWFLAVHFRLLIWTFAPVARRPPPSATSCRHLFRITRRR